MLRNAYVINTAVFNVAYVAHLHIFADQNIL